MRRQNLNLLDFQESIKNFREKYINVSYNNSKKRKLCEFQNGFNYSYDNDCKYLKFTNNNY